MSINTVPARAIQILAQNPQAFATALRALDAVAERGREHNQARAWMIQAVELRYPDASQAVEDAYLAAEDTGANVDYVGVLLEAAGL